MRIVIDTHVIFSGASFSSSYTGQIMQSWLKQREIEVAISPLILIELRRVIHYPFVMNRYHWTERQNELFLRTLCRKGVIVEAKTVISISKDKDDNMWFACAEAANAEYIVSKNDDILDVGEYKGIKTVKPGYFVEQVLPQLKKKG